MKLIDLTGQRFGKLAVLHKGPAIKGGSKWLCRCDCGNEVFVTSRWLRHATQPTRSCGCLRTYKKTVWMTPVRVCIIDSLRAQGKTFPQIKTELQYHATHQSLANCYRWAKTQAARKQSDARKLVRKWGLSEETRALIGESTGNPSELAAATGLAERSVLRLRAKRLPATVGPFDGLEGDVLWLNVRGWLWIDGLSWFQIRNRLAKANGIHFVTAEALEIAWNDAADRRSGVIGMGLTG